MYSKQEGKVGLAIRDCAATSERNLSVSKYFFIKLNTIENKVQVVSETFHNQSVTNTHISNLKHSYVKKIIASE
jgi:predicted RNA-binding protein with RPS1 domain